MPEPLAIGFGLRFEEAIAAARARKVQLPDEYYGAVAQGARRAATTISGLTGLDQVQRVMDSLNKALHDGDTLADWQRRVADDTWALPSGRTETIFRTNIQTAYGAGHWRQFEEGRNRRPYLMWSAINDSRVRPAHLAMDGHIAPVDDPIWRVWHPPAGYNCRCSQISLTEAQARARGYGRQQVPDGRPDQGFADLPPGDLEAALAQARQARIASATPSLGRALERRQAAAVVAPVASGAPVSNALAVAAGRSEALAELRATMDIIDQVHGDGALPQIPVRLTRTKKTEFGHYASNPLRDSALRIGVSRYGDHQRLTFAHEIGHFLDHKGWGGRGFSSEVEAAAELWRQAATASPTYQRLVAIRSTTAQRKYVRYLLETRELWARSYAQWVAIRSNDPVMVAQLTKIKSTVADVEYSLSQWDSIEFRPIAKAIDDLFTLLGWRK